MIQHGPWKIKSSEVKYQNPWMTVREDQVIQPDGKDSAYAVVIPKNSGVAVVAIDSEENVYLVEEFRYAQGRYMINAICGFMEPGETPEETARREVKEEVGVEIAEVMLLGKTYPYAGTLDYLNHSMLAKVKGVVEKVNQDGTESIRLKKVPLAEAVAMVMDSRIMHAESCTAILRAARYLGK